MSYPTMEAFATHCPSRRSACSRRGAGRARSGVILCAVAILQRFPELGPPPLSLRIREDECRQVTEVLQLLVEPRLRRRRLPGPGTRQGARTIWHRLYNRMVSVASERLVSILHPDDRRVPPADRGTADSLTLSRRPRERPRGISVRHVASAHSSRTQPSPLWAWQSFRSTPAVATYSERELVLELVVLAIDGHLDHVAKAPSILSNSSLAARPGSCASDMAVITAAPDTPVAMMSPTFCAVTPPMARTGKLTCLSSE